MKPNKLPGLKPLLGVRWRTGVSLDVLLSQVTILMHPFPLSFPRYSPKELADLALIENVIRLQVDTLHAMAFNSPQRALNELLAAVDINSTNQKSLWDPKYREALLTRAKRLVAELEEPDEVAFRQSFEVGDPRCGPTVAGH